MNLRYLLLILRIGGALIAGVLYSGSVEMALQALSISLALWLYFTTLLVFYVCLYIVNFYFYIKTVGPQPKPRKGHKGHQLQLLILLTNLVFSVIYLADHGLLLDLHWLDIVKYGALDFLIAFPDIIFGFLVRLYKQFRDNE